MQQIVERLAVQAAKSVDLEALLEIARAAQPLSYNEVSLEPLGKARIAIARIRPSASTTRMLLIY